MSRRTALASSFAGAAALALSACARGTMSLPAPSDVLSLFNDNPSWAPGFEDAGRELRTAAGYRLAPRAVPNVSNYQQIVRMSAQTDSSADLIKWWNGYRLRDVARAGILADVTPAWDEAERRGWCDDPTLRASFTSDGRQYGVPLYKSYYAVFYSKPLFARLGLEVPTTWQEFLHIVDAAHARRITPIASGGATTWESSIWFQQLLNGLDHQFYLDLTAGKRSYTDARCREAMGLWSDLYRRGAFSSPDVSASDLPGRFAQGRTAMYLYGTWNTGAFLDAGVKDADLGAFLLPPPPGGNRSVLVESGVLAVSAHAHKRGAALKAARSWLDPSVQKAWTGFLRDTSADPSVVPDVGAVRDVVAQVRDERPSQAVRYWEASPPVLIEGNVQDLSAFMIDPTAARAAQTLQSMQRRAEKEWKAWKS
ncbi:ABC transporter substrate-binding protein [Streptomyces sp. 8L]|uniref:ABC transporter substrate-binding protein n=1 Tax=Streptomyces sp. 8L TaxID=2877242 RepID=UPI001CD2B3BF|nr:extracellular solute-binding protein [Streptomyces sp. 8L]MCA1221153.1 extracellular solute-binding protein [Streptomyces sp. 8L]